MIELDLGQVVVGHLEDAHAGPHPVGKVPFAELLLAPPLLSGPFLIEVGAVVPIAVEDANDGLVIERYVPTHDFARKVRDAHHWRETPVRELADIEIFHVLSGVVAGEV